MQKGKRERERIRGNEKKKEGKEKERNEEKESEKEERKFQVLPSHPNNSIQHYSFVCTQLNAFKYSYQKLSILFQIIYSFAHSQMVSNIAM